MQSKQAENMYPGVVQGAETEAAIHLPWNTVGYLTINWNPSENKIDKLSTLFQKPWNKNFETR
jgi:hypothetical protein